MDQLGYIEIYGEMIPITWDDYLSLLWNKSEEFVIVKVPVKNK
jgi:hypothetical protein